MLSASAKFITKLKETGSYDLAVSMTECTDADFASWFEHSDFKEAFLSVMANKKLSTKFRAEYNALCKLQDVIANGLQERTVVTKGRVRNHKILAWEDVTTTVKTYPVDPKTLMQFLDLKQGMTLATALAVIQDAAIFPVWFVEFIISIADDEKTVTDKRLATEMAKYLAIVANTEA
jgi:hypothetical protein